ncbi:MAG TPA: L,D-transpeptidase family protein [Burkholderiales bacterium]|nr:L,D-transpeptidase family protein [Burkholderiales bacterium]
MDDHFIESRKAVAKARESMRIGDHAEARVWAERAAELAPGTEDPWLLLAAVANPQESVELLKKALTINPGSPRAQRGMQWARQRLGETPQTRTPSVMLAQPARPARPAPKRRSPIFPALLFTLGCVVIAFSAWSASTSPALAAILNLGGAAQAAPAAHPQSWAHAEIAKPTQTFMSVSGLQLATATSAATLPDLPTEVAPPIPTETQVVVAVVPQLPRSNVIPQQRSSEDQSVGPGLSDSLELPNPQPAADIPDLPAPALPGPSADDPLPVDPAVVLPTETPGVMYAEIVADTPTSVYVAPTAAAFEPAPVPSGGYGERWIDVDLSQQRVYAYEGDSVVNSFIVSTGTWQTPTVTGRYKVWIKLRSTTMAGPGYYLTNVPFTMYFYKGYGLHGTYWHNNFGTPMSHGCVNLPLDVAAWMYGWAPIGTAVSVIE